MIRLNTNPFYSLVHIVKKKGGEWMMVVDYVLLKATTVKRKYPLPIIDELLVELSSVVWFSKLNLKASYH